MFEESRKMAARPTAGKPARGQEPKPGEDSAYVKWVKRNIEKELGKRDEYYRRRRDHLRRGELRFDIGRYEDALTHLLEACRGTRDDGGHCHMRLAALYAMMGKKDLCKSAVEEASGRVTEVGQLSRLERFKKWLAAVDENRAKAQRLKTGIAADEKDADGRWQLLELYARAYPRPLDRLMLLVEFKERYPRDRRVTGGDCDWRLADSLWDFGLRGEALKLAKAHREKYPGHRSSKRGDATLRLGRWCHHLGSYAEALKCYEEMQAKYPKHWVNEPGDDGTTWLQHRLVDVRNRQGGRRHP
jgi:tetratricopeptide (TPR) repeat protein